MKVAIVGAGIGGLAAAVLLAAKGCEVTVLERAASPGGKMREVEVGNARIDAGPTVFTMRWVFEEIFAEAGADLASAVKLQPAGILARHAWAGQGRLDLFADTQATAQAIGEFAGAAEAQGFLAFCEESCRIYATLEQSFIRGARPTPFSLVRDAGFAGLGGLLAIKPFQTMWAALGGHFADPRLRQLFGRYATYCGSSPYLAPATLMLVAHVEREGVWLVQGGMRRLADALAALAAKRGAVFRYGAHVEKVGVRSGRASGLVLGGGEPIEADAVILNADAAALAAGLFGAPVQAASPPVPSRDRSLSAITWAMVAQTEGFPLVRHNVFFSGDYEAEFRALAAGRVPGEPTLYVCAQDRADGEPAHAGPERLLCLANAPANGDTRAYDQKEIDACARQSFLLLQRCGLIVRRTEAETVVTTPSQFAALFPATGGALYGQAVHGAMASFRRPGSRSRLPGLYLAGGSTHPGAGVPMAALSGRQAAASLLADRISARR
jgi:1-hydroxycarotenoid 3,4-desaturase